GGRIGYRGDPLNVGLAVGHSPARRPFGPATTVRCLETGAPHSECLDSRTACQRTDLFAGKRCDPFPPEPPLLPRGIFQNSTTRRSSMTPTATRGGAAIPADSDAS